MLLKPAIQHAVARKLEEYEGRHNHLYLDTVGEVTVGIGHLIPDRHSIASVQMYVTQNGHPTTPATTVQKQAEYDHISKQKRNYRAAWYKQFCTLQMRDSDINVQRDHHINNFHTELTSLYSRANGYRIPFDEMPDEVQMALFDMIFNLGATRLQSQFIKFNAAIKSQDWVRASQESNRPQVSMTRNTYVKQLFQAAHRNSIPAQP